MIYISIWQYQYQYIYIYIVWQKSHCRTRRDIFKGDWKASSSRVSGPLVKQKDRKCQGFKNTSVLKFVFYTLQNRESGTIDSRKLKLNLILKFNFNFKGSSFKILRSFFVTLSSSLSYLYVCIYICYLYIRVCVCEEKKLQSLRTNPNHLVGC